MSEKERNIAESLTRACELLPDGKKEYLIGYAEGVAAIAFRLTCPAEKANARKNVSGLCHRRAEIHYRKHSKICRRKLHEDPIS